jgi:3-keto-disaccharide hydrolase
MKPVRLIVALLLCLSVFAFKSVRKDNWKQLFNGKDLSGWDTYIGPDLDEKGKPITGVPIGLNNDPRHVFTIVNENGENIIRISGENWGAISTNREYENYHLRLQFKWGKLLWGQKKGQKMDSGLLYHSVGKYGADYGAWMRSQEFQIEQGNCGEYWGVAGGMADIPAVQKSGNDYGYDPAGKLMTFSEGSKPQGRHCIKLGDAENPTGEWNTIDLYCHGDTSIHVVNGKVMMILYHNRQNENGQELPLTKGKIQIQSEGAEVYYRHIEMESIDKLPAELLK